MISRHNRLYRNNRISSSRPYNRAIPVAEDESKTSSDRDLESTTIKGCSIIVLYNRPTQTAVMIHIKKNYDSDMIDQKGRAIDPNNQGIEKYLLAKTDRSILPPESTDILDQIKKTFDVYVIPVDFKSIVRFSPKAGRFNMY